jgi:Mitochondrial K+-H+ exchange-related
MAEQRLLWRLRGCRAAALVHPEDVPDDRARELLRRQLNRDFERHRFWLAVDSLGLIASAVLALLPGPNLVAYYFLFRIVGHFLSVRGARHGLVKCDWDLQPSAALASLRTLAALPPPARAERIRAVASELGLEHFEAFFDKTSA